MFRFATGGGVDVVAALEAILGLFENGAARTVGVSWT